MIVICTIAFSLAYFSARVIGNANEDVVQTGIMKLTYTDNSDINFENIFPGFTATKYFSVENTGNVETLYDIKLINFTNQIINNEMEYILKCKSYITYYGKDNEENVLKGDCYETDGSFEVIDNSSKTIIDNIYIKPEYTYVYELTINFLETNELQNYNMEKLFTGSIDIQPSETSRITLLEQILSDLKKEEFKNNISKITESKLKTDYIQPWMILDYTYDQILRNLELLKRAGINNIILTNAVSLSNVQVNAVPKFNTTFYQTNLNQYFKKDTTKYDVFEKVLNAAEELNMEVYLGLTSTEDWWNFNKVKNQTWQNNNINVTNEVITELYNLFNTKSSFKGFYYSDEMFFNNENLEIEWSKMLNSSINTINNLNNTIPIITSTFISTLYDLSLEEIRNKWDTFFDTTNFRSIDIFTMQDGLSTVPKDPNYITNIYGIIKDLTDENNLIFDLNIELFDEEDPLNMKTIKKKMEIASYYANALQSFSYTYYFSPYIKSREKYYNIFSNDIYYREYIGQNTENDIPITILKHIPNEGSIYFDKNRDEAPLPSGFTVVDDKNTIKEGLVIKDNYDNEFVWVPVNGEVKNIFYNYTDDDGGIIHYARNNGDLSFYNSVTNDVFPAGVSNDTNQINKYKGFYVGRFESQLDYNLENFRVKIFKGDEDKVNLNFAWQHADTDYYSGTLWNNIKYEDAKTYAESMSSSYSYHNSVKTGLLTGKAWDTVIRFLTYDDETYTFSWDSRGWGNHSDSNGKAATGNYSPNTLRNTGTNEGWKLKNIYDIAGNLWEWTNETNGSGEYVIRGGKYNSSGGGAPASSAMLTESYQFKHTGFRVMLYIE